MPLLFQKDIRPGTSLHVWEIREASPEELGPDLLTLEEENRLSRMKTQKRRMQWIAVRALLKHCLPGEQATIGYHSSGEPHLINCSHHISITHSGNLAAISLSRGKPHGIDIQECTGKVENIAHKFLSEQEREWTDQHPDPVNLLTLLWSAKEAIYKSFREVVDFRKDMTISSFEPSKEGRIRILVSTNREKEEHYIGYERLRDSYLTYLIE